MSKQANKRRKPRPAPRAKTAGAAWVCDGVPVFDGVRVTVCTARDPLTGGRRDSVLLAVGPCDGKPAALVELCPCLGVDDVVRQLLDAASVAAEHHESH